MGIFPNEAAVVRLAGAVLADMHDECQAAERRYLCESSCWFLPPLPWLSAFQFMSKSVGLTKSSLGRPGEPDLD